MNKYSFQMKLKGALFKICDIARLIHKRLFKIKYKKFQRYIQYKKPHIRDS